MTTTEHFREIVKACRNNQNELSFVLGALIGLISDVEQAETTAQYAQGQADYLRTHRDTTK